MTLRERLAGLLPSRTASNSGGNDGADSSNGRRRVAPATLADTPADIEPPADAPDECPVCGDPYVAVIHPSADPPLRPRRMCYVGTARDSVLAGVDVVHRADPDPDQEAP